MVPGFFFDGSYFFASCYWQDIKSQAESRRDFRYHNDLK